MGNYKLIALDIDGTLLNEHGKVSAANRSAVEAAVEAGFTVILATGRGIQSAQPVAEELNLHSAPVITVNGGEVWRSLGTLFKRHQMEIGWMEEMHAQAVEYGAWYWAYAVEGMFNRENWPQNIRGLTWLKFGFGDDDPAKVDMIHSRLSALGRYEIANSHPTNLEVNPRGVSKASGIREVCGFLGIPLSQVIAVGDSMNDIQMIRSAGLGVAMGNAQDAVKQAADFVTGTNADDGVSQVIRAFMLGEKAASE